MPKGTWVDGRLIRPDLFDTISAVKYRVYQNIDPNDSEPAISVVGYLKPVALSIRDFNELMRTTFPRVTGIGQMKRRDDTLVTINFLDPPPDDTEQTTIETAINNHAAVEITPSKTFVPKDDTTPITLSFKAPVSVTSVIPTINGAPAPAVTMTNGQGSMQMRPSGLTDDALEIGVQTYDHDPVSIVVEQQEAVGSDPTKLPRPTLTDDNGVTVVSNPDTSATTINAHIDTLDAQIRASAGVTAITPLETWLLNSVVVLLKVVHWLVSREIKRL